MVNFLNVSDLSYTLQLWGLKPDVGLCPEKINKTDILVYRLTFPAIGHHLVRIKKTSDYNLIPIYCTLFICTANMHKRVSFVCREKAKKSVIIYINITQDNSGKTFVTEAPSDWISCINQAS